MERSGCTASNILGHSSPARCTTMHQWQASQWHTVCPDTAVSFAHRQAKHCLLLWVGCRGQPPCSSCGQRLRYSAAPGPPHRSHWAGIPAPAQLMPSCSAFISVARLLDCLALHCSSSNCHAGLGRASQPAMAPHKSTYSVLQGACGWAWLSMESRRAAQWAHEGCTGAC